MAPAPPAVLGAVFVGGSLGGLARHGLAEAFTAGASDGTWPTGTLVANIAGAFLLGVVLAAFAAPHVDRRAALLGPGLCGALTTFSALQIEVVRLADDGHAATAVALLAVTLAAGAAAVLAGGRVGRTLRGDDRGDARPAPT